MQMIPVCCSATCGRPSPAGCPMNLPELLAPAGNLEKLKIAVHCGADAVYLSGKRYGLRSHAGNFTPAEIEEGVRHARANRVKVYVTVNIIARNRDLQDLPEYLASLAMIGVDGLIVSDPGVIACARRCAPGLPLHLSTQLSTSNRESARFWQEQGVARINLARELSLREVAEIKARVGCEIEIFVHGAICIAYSGRCLLSTYLTHRESNRGECAHPCRWKYALVEETRPRDCFPIAEDERGSYIFNSKDLCLIEHLPEVLKTGVDAIKIEGRMKGINYVAGATRVYRRALDSYRQDPDRFQVHPEWLAELRRLSHRDYTTGFALGMPAAGDYTYSTSDYLGTHELVAVVTHDPPPGNAAGRWVRLDVRNRITRGELIEFVDRELRCHTGRLAEMTDERGNPLDEAHPGRQVLVRTDLPVGKNDLLRRKKP
jgi:U32 family peptidase